MKYAVCMIIAIITLSHNGLAQRRSSKSKTRFGVKAGYNYVNSTNISSIAVDNTNGFHAGVFFSGEEDNVKAGSDFLFSKQGYKYKNGKVYMNYLSTTETADFFVVEDIFKLQIGLQIGYLLSAIADSSGITFNTPSKKATDYFTRFSFGIAGGAELISESGLSIGMRYTVGLNNLLKTYQTNRPVPAFLPALPNAILKSNIFQVYAGFRF
ncbi:outer membrane beta-barrel protein [Ferruginibacter sp.]|uniref:outer membrane beta-barrel protein n=1 Tax=Ferruginibacter sp. TaxID=1940288 RepID=UPI00265A60C3|nr:outer membrane beta-barrel protein [Ferruginibacter sp.]